MNIRKATGQDGPVLLHLIHALAEYEKLDPPDAGAQKRLVAELSNKNPRFEAYIADEGEVPVGYAIIFETYSSFAALPVLYLEDLFVLPEFRKKKAGLALFRSVVSEAQRRGCARLEWVVLSWNEPAIQFYRKLGAVRLSDWHTYRLTGDLFQSVLGGR